MKLLRLLSRNFCAVLILAVTGCAQAPHAPPPQPWDNLPPVREDTIGRLQVDGPNAFINSMPAANGAYVRNGDLVSTGAKTNARIILNPPGGLIQLDENTDPEFTLIKQGACLLIKFAKGQGLLKNVQCVQAEAGSLQIVLKSLVNLKTTEQETQVTVLEGQVDVTSPTGAVVGLFQQYSLTRAGETRLLQLTSEQAHATAAWAQGYFQQPTAGQESGLSTAGVVAGFLAAFGLYHALHDHPSSHSQPKSTPPPATTGTPVNSTPPAVGGAPAVPRQ
jgi:hypothetical protein